MWNIPDIAALGQLQGAIATCYDACVHGGQRKKAQKLPHNLRELDKLNAWFLIGWQAAERRWKASRRHCWPWARAG